MNEGDAEGRHDEWDGWGQVNATTVPFMHHCLCTQSAADGHTNVHHANSMKHRITCGFPHSFTERCICRYFVGWDVEYHLRDVKAWVQDDSDST
jgi:hypothetical protein